MSTTTVDLAAFDALCADVLAKDAELERLRAQVAKLEAHGAEWLGPMLYGLLLDNIRGQAAEIEQYKRRAGELWDELERLRAWQAEAVAELQRCKELLQRLGPENDDLAAKLAAASAELAELQGQLDRAESSAYHLSEID